MSDCGEILTQIVFYLDDELEESEKGALEAHFNVCRTCSQQLYAEKRFLDLIRGVKPLYVASPELRAASERILSSAPVPVEAPARLRRRVSGSLRLLSGVAERASYDWRIPVLGSIVIVISIAALWGVFKNNGSLRQDFPSDFTRTAVDAHLRHLRGQLPLEIASHTAEAVSAWFTGKVSFKMELSQPQDLIGGGRSFDIEGARLVGFKSDYAAYVAYEMKGHPVSLLIASAETAKPSGGQEVRSKGIDFHYDSFDGLNVITWADRGLTYALVSDMDKRGRESCAVCHQGPKDQANADLSDLLNSTSP
ncbi:MAG TPA: zf-HC2 domain-containing protein [Blastocatellia bacterium]